MKMWFDSTECKIIASAVKNYKETITKLFNTCHPAVYETLDALQEMIDLCDDILAKCDNADD